jgi:hypothetical protein
VDAGGVAQVRHQNGGIHHRAQDFQRLHFGLGAESLVDRVAVLWPSGLTQVLENVAADQILAIVETSDTACGDGMDNDGDGLTDYPEDTFCESWSQDAEQPECQDGMDNDGDGLADLADPDCRSPFQLLERPPRCGLGFEIAFLLLPLMLLSQRQRLRAARLR